VRSCLLAHGGATGARRQSDYVTGTTLFVDGGMTLYPAFRGNG
jgi:glucose 1-dehydrogenase